LSGIRFIDADVTLGVENVVLANRPLGSEDTLNRLLECGIQEALVAHNAAVEGDPVSGNEMLGRVLAEQELGSHGVTLHAAWALVPLSTGELGPPEDVRAMLERGGVRGALLYPEMHGFSAADWCCGELYEMLEAVRLPLFTRLNLDFGYDALFTLLTNHPGLRVILRNADYRMPRNIYRLFDLFESLAVESGRYSPFGGIEDVVRRWGAERLVFGSGAPGYSPGAAVAMVTLADIDDAAKRRISGGNLRAMMEGIRYGA
jgi:hypothetical protein